MKFASTLLSSTLLSMMGIALCDCVAEDAPDDELLTSAEPIIGGTNVAAQYPEAATLLMSGGTLPVPHVCSATLIAPKVVLTAGHCVDGPTTWQVNVGAQSQTTTRAATFDWNSGGSIDPAHHDIGLLFLSQAIVLTSYPTIAQTMASSGAQVMNVGRTHDGVQTNTLWGAVTTGLTVSPSFPYTYLTTDVIQGGDSGGPDFLLGTHTIIAVNSFTATAAPSGTPIEGLARVDQLYGWITRPIDDPKFFVRQTYLDVLRREPDPGGLASWSNPLLACNGAPACVASTRISIARGIFESAENRVQDPDLDPASLGYKSAFVTHCYTSFLQRQPDAAGFASWLNALNSSGDYNGTVSGFINSTEYRQRFNSL